VNHDRIVGLADRLAYILKRYGRDQVELCNAIKANFNLCQEVETKLFDKLNFSADMLARLARDEKIQVPTLEKKRQNFRVSGS
jgi:hypothetical protein